MVVPVPRIFRPHFRPATIALVPDSDAAAGALGDLRGIDSDGSGLDHTYTTIYYITNLETPKLAAELVLALTLGWAWWLFEPSHPPGFVRNCTVPGTWCAVNGFDHAVENALRAPESYSVFVAIVSHVFTVIFAQLLAFYIVVANRPQNVWTHLFLLVPPTIFANGVNMYVKVHANRQRPCFHAGRERWSEAATIPAQEFKSFYSGDAQTGCVTLAAAITVAFMRGDTLGRLFPAALFVGCTGAVLRVVADMHWPTDVLVGLIMGTAMGAGIPLLFHRRSRRR